MKLREGVFFKVETLEDQRKAKEIFLSIYPNCGFIFDPMFKLYYGIIDKEVRHFNGKEQEFLTVIITKNINSLIEKEDELTSLREHPLTMKDTIQEQSMREFSTGATRNLDQDKIDYEGFLSPLALEAFGKYMHKNRLQADGELRNSDNWQKGIPISAYMKSMWRHFFDTWKRYRGLETPEDQITNLCGLMFNVQGMLHELIKGQTKLLN